VNKTMAKAHRAAVDHWCSNLVWALANEPSSMKISKAQCSLCVACGFRQNTYAVEPDCAKCLVTTRSRRSGCLGTPWVRVKLLRDTLIMDEHPPEKRKALLKKLVVATERMVWFIESLEE